MGGNFNSVLVNYNSIDFAQFLLLMHAIWRSKCPLISCFPYFLDKIRCFCTVNSEIKENYLSQKWLVHSPSSSRTIRGTWARLRGGRHCRGGAADAEIVFWTYPRVHWIWCLFIGARAPRSQFDWLVLLRFDWLGLRLDQSFNSRTLFR